MKVEVVMPKMGESLTEGTILKWHKKVGDKIERDETLLEISTDKVDTEVPSPASGIVVQLLGNENDTIEVNKTIAIIETDVANAEIKPEPAPVKIVAPQKPAAPAQTQATVPAPSPAPAQAKAIVSSGNLTDIVMPKMGESLTEGTILKWHKKAGDKIERDETLLEISTDKVDTEVPSPVDGIVAEILYEENITVEVGTTIARISTSGDVKVSTPSPIVELKEAEPASVAQSATVVPVQTEELKRTSGKKFFSPVVREIAKAENISAAELDSLTGSGIDGRISKKDILNYIEAKKSGHTTQIISKTASAPVVLGQDDEVIQMDRVRQLISEHMIYSKKTSAHVTSVAEADVSGIVKYRAKFKDDFEKREGYKLTYTPFFAKAIIDAVKLHPLVNVSVEGKTIIKHNRINLGIATALDNGNLIVPVVKNSDTLSISGLSQAIFDLSTRARTKKLNPDEIKDGTISLTNVGTFGTLFGTPIINQPQCAIIGVGAIKKRPVVTDMNGESVIVIRDMIYVSITYDHRVIDGMLAGKCLFDIVKSLESMNEETLNM
ncbi:MAG: 2-oxoglutarate dehydrogenase, E2 component, dihydrolipoamide succinyltransferase [Bacteroidota bacterium]